MRFNRISVGVYPDQGWRVQWSIDGIDNTMEIAIERASSPEGPWSEEGVVAWNVVAFEDIIPTPSGFFTEQWYRLNVRLLGGGATQLLSDPVATRRAGTKVTNEIIRQHELLLKGVNTSPGFFSHRFVCYKHAKNGTPCPYCVDPNTGEFGLVVNCEACGGIGLLEGWAEPIEFYGSWKEPINVNRYVDYSGNRENLIRNLFTAAFPIIEPGDILVEKDGFTYEVTDIRVSKPGGIITSQWVTCHGVDPKNFIYDILTFPNG